MSLELLSTARGRAALQIQFHDILYKTFRDILYLGPQVSRAEGILECGLQIGWLGES
jgi:hypothetical protein